MKSIWLPWIKHQMILLNYGGFVCWVCLSGTTIDVRIWGNNYLFLSDCRMARGHFNPKQSFEGNWKLLTGVLQTGTRQLACISRVCVRLCCMSMKFNWQIMAGERQLAQLALQRLYRMPQDYRFVGLIIAPASTKLKGGNTGFTSSVRLSVRLWTESCPLCNFQNTNRILFISAHLIKQLQMCRV